MENSNLVEELLKLYAPDIVFTELDPAIVDNDAIGEIVSDYANTINDNYRSVVGEDLENNVTNLIACAVIIKILPTATIALEFSNDYNIIINVNIDDTKSFALSLE